MTSVMTNRDGTTEITYNDNRKLKFAPGVDAGLTYPCPHAPTCRVFFYTQDDLNQHRILEHAEIPKNLLNLSTEGKSRYFNKISLYKMNGTIQQEHLRRLLLVVGVDVEAVKKPILKKLKEWWDGRNKPRN